MEDFEVSYSDGVVSVYQMEHNADHYVIEFFPDNQTNESYEKCEFKGSIGKSKLLNDEYTPYELHTFLSTPQYLPEEELDEIIEKIKINLVKD